MVERIQQILSELNDEQREAVLYNDGDSLVLAGAGSGKTRVLTTKIAYLISSGVNPDEILALTFTNKASLEMKERISSMLGGGEARSILMGTFHSVFARFLRRYADRLGYAENYSIYDQSSSQALVKVLVKRLEEDEKIYKHKKMSALISSFKNDGISPKRVMEDRTLQAQLLHRRIPRFGELYSMYCEHCFRANAMDFDDLLINMMRLLEKEPEIRQTLHEQFKYILVDEYQDTNRVQHRIVELLKGKSSRVCVVGDDAQSIYSFRGAVIDNIIDFQRSFPGARLFKLTKNYRSTHTIVALANTLIAKNSKRIPKEVVAVAGKGEAVDLLGSSTGGFEGQTVAARISVLISKGVSPDEIAVLYRKNAQSRLIEEALRGFNVPYRIFGGTSYFDRKEVKDVLAYLRLTINPKDDEAFRRIYNVPARGIGPTTFEELEKVASREGRPLLEVAQDKFLLSQYLKPAAIRKIDAFVALLRLFTEQVHEMEPEPFLEFLISQSRITTLYEDGSIESETKLQNIYELKSALTEYLVRHEDREQEEFPPTIEGFIQEIVLLTEQEEGAEDQPKVTLMTMHASKGLEFPYVFITGVEEGILPSLRDHSTEEVEEERRLFYVALTRAMRQCIISFATERTIHGKTEKTTPSRFVYDLDPNLVNDYSHILRATPPTPTRPQRPLETSTTGAPTQRRVTKIIRRPAQRSSEGGKSSAPSLKERSLECSFAKGDYVYHDKFGRGEVLGFTDSISGTQVHIDFGQGGTKVLILKFARLREEASNAFSPKGE